MLATSTVLFLESVCKLAARPIKHMIVYNSLLSEELEEIAVHVHQREQNRRKQIARQRQQKLKFKVVRLSNSTDNT
jgi:uncharacterized membrane protein